jgi:putative redox protein
MARNTIGPGAVEALQLTLDKGGAIVTERGDGKFTQVMLDGEHVLLADEPRQAGGDDRGPSPYGLLLMALGACTSMTLRLYADRKGWPVERITVRLKHFRDYAKDCKDCDDKNVQIERIERVIDVEGDLDDSQHLRLLEIAEKCPVHRTLESRVKIESRLAE